MNPWLAIIMVLISLMILIGSLYGLKKYLSPEWSRKILHIVMGCITLTFPWLFHEIWPVIILGILATSSLLIVKYLKTLHKSIGTVIHGVARQSEGEIYFPLAVVIVFTLAQGDWLLFFIPILILTIADAAAALIGLRYGLNNYKTDDGFKSIEGSIAFLLIAFLSIHLTLLLFTETGRLESVLIGLIVGLLVMLIEAFSWRGLDNLFVPIGGFFLLTQFLLENATELSYHLIIIILLTLLVIYFAKKATLNGNAVTAYVLMTYLCLVVGGWNWLIIALLFLMSYPLLTQLPPFKKAMVFGIEATMSVGFAPLIWLIFYYHLQDNIFFYAFTVSLTIYLNLIAVKKFCQRYPNFYFIFNIVIANIIAWLIFMPTYYLLNPNPEELIIAFIILVLSALVFYFIQAQAALADIRFWIKQGLVSFIGSILAIIYFILG